MQVGQYREDGATIVSGLAAGDVVVSAGVHKLRDGQPVRLTAARGPRRRALKPRRWSTASTCRNGRSAHRTLVLYFMIVLAVIGVGSYLRLGQAEDPGLHLQGHGGAHELAGRLRRRGRAPAHRPHREEAAGDAAPGPPAQLLQARRVRRLRLREGLVAGRRDQGHVVPGEEEGRRHPRPASRRHPGPVLQRRVRRHLRQHLRAHRRRLQLRAAQGGRRPHPRRPAARARRGQGGADRRAGREDLRRDRQRQARHAGRGARRRLRRPRAAERGGLLRELRDRHRPPLHPHERRARLRGERARASRARQRAALPAGRHRHRHARLLRPAAAEDALHGPRRAGRGGLHGARRRHHRARRGARRRGAAHPGGASRRARARPRERPARRR